LKETKFREPKLCEAKRMKDFFSAVKPGTSVEERIKDESVKDSASPKNQKGFNITIEKLTFALNRQ
jgi:hypothetical protein